MWVSQENKNSEGYCLVVEGLKEYIRQFEIELSPEDQNNLENTNKFVDESDPEELANEVLSFIKKEGEKYNFSTGDLKRLLPYAIQAYLTKKFGLFGLEILQSNPLFVLKIEEAEIILHKKLEESAKQETHSVDVEKLAKEYIQYLKEKTKTDKMSELYRKFYLYLNEFLDKKGLRNYQIKRLLEDTIRVLLREEMEKEERERILEEQKLVPKLVEEIVEWTRANNLKRIRKTDVEAFLVEKNFGDLHYLTKDSIWKLANAKLKTK